MSDLNVIRQIFENPELTGGDNALQTEEVPVFAQALIDSGAVVPSYGRPITVEQLIEDLTFGASVTGATGLSAEGVFEIVKDFVRTGDWYGEDAFRAVQAGVDAQNAPPPGAATGTFNGQQGVSLDEYLAGIFVPGQESYVGYYPRGLDPNVPYDSNSGFAKTEGPELSLTQIAQDIAYSGVIPHPPEDVFAILQYTLHNDTSLIERGLETENLKYTLTPDHIKAFVSALANMPPEVFEDFVNTERLTYDIYESGQGANAYALGLQEAGQNTLTLDQVLTQSFASFENGVIDSEEDAYILVGNLAKLRDEDGLLLRHTSVYGANNSLDHLLAYLIQEVRSGTPVNLTEATSLVEDARSSRWSQSLATKSGVYYNANFDEADEAQRAQISETLRAALGPDITLEAFREYMLTNFPNLQEYPHVIDFLFNSANMQGEGGGIAPSPNSTPDLLAANVMAFWALTPEEQNAILTQPI